MDQNEVHQNRGQLPALTCREHGRSHAGSLKPDTYKAGDTSTLIWDEASHLKAYTYSKTGGRYQGSIELQ